MTRPKHFDGTKTHPFCSKACAKNANGLTNGLARKQTLNGGAQPSKGEAALHGNENDQTELCSAPGICQAPNCQNTVHTNANGSLGEYCSMAHKT